MRASQDGHADEPSPSTGFDSGRRLRWAYITALSLIALLAIGEYVRLHRAFLKQKTDANIVSLAMDQRNETNQLTETALIILNRSAKTSVVTGGRDRNLRRQILEWRSGQQRLLANGFDDSQHDDSTERACRLFEILGSHFQSMDHAANQLELILASHIETEESADALGRAVNRMLNDSALYIPALNDLVLHFQESSQEKVAKLEREMSYFTMLILLVLVLEALVVFEPARRRLESQAKGLISARIKAEEAMRTKASFLANMSHEIRTPMNAIIGFTDSLLEEGRTDEQRADDVRIIKRNGQHLISIINSILDMSKLDAGQVQVESVTMSLTDVVGDVTRLMRLEAERKGLMFETDFAFPIPQVIASDPTRIRQILLNLLSNAIKFTESGRVTLGVSCEDRGERTLVRFRVEDTGVGMDAKVIETVFQPFTQADSSITRKFGGTGLGLSITRRLVELMDGDVTAESEPGVGSVFEVSLPVEHIDFAPEIYAETEDDASLTGARADDERFIEKSFRVRILVVEDGADNRRLVSHILDKAGASVTAVENGLEALNAIASAQVPFHLVLMDMQMPVMDGYTATRQLRRDDFWQPIIALTAHSLPSDREDCLMAGCDDFLTKPIDREKLIRTCAKHIRRSSHMQSVNPGEAA